MRAALLRIATIAVFLVAASIFAFLNRHDDGSKRADSELATVLPVPLQIFFSGGDRNLAANVGVWRALMVGTGKLPKDVLHALAMVQLDASWLNPAHEDNYYLATAILPWEGEYASAQMILKRSMEVRQGDFLPGFFYGFNKLQFEGDALAAAEALIEASKQAADPGDQQALKVMAARWSERQSDLSAAIALQESLATSTKDVALRRYLLQRVELMRGLQLLREAYQRCRERGLPVNVLRQVEKCVDRPLLWDERRWSDYGLVSGGVVIVAK